MPRKYPTKRKGRFKRASTPKYTALMHGRRFKSKKKKPVYNDGFERDRYGRIKGTYYNGIFYPD